MADILYSFHIVLPWCSCFSRWEKNESSDGDDLGAGLAICLWYD